MQNILGISFGTRSIGFAIISNKVLLDCYNRNFKGKWRSNKLQDIIICIRNEIERNEITEIILKIPVQSHCSNNIKQAKNEIEALCLKLGIRLKVITIRELKEGYRYNGARTSKQVFIQSLAEKYPQFHLEYQKQMRRSYYARLFEAIACAEIALETGK